MARRLEQSPFFFKILLGDFPNKLRIPPAFVKEFKGNVPREVILKSNAGFELSWPVRVRQEEAGYYFQGGWPDFARDHNLEEGEFLIFSMLGSSVFHVRIGSRKCCEKKITIAPAERRRRRGRPPSQQERQIQTKSKGAATSCSKKERGSSSTAKRKKDSDDEVEFVSESRHSDHSSSFILAFKPYKQYSIYVPNTFAEAAGLKDKREVRIEDATGRSRTLGVWLGPNQVWLTAGWCNLCEENKLAEGDTVLFQFISRTDSIRVQILTRAADGRGKTRNKRV